MSSNWTGYLEVDDSGFVAKINNADAKLDNTRAKAKETSLDVEQSVTLSFFKMRMIGHAAYMIINEIFNAMGIELGALGQIVESAIQVAVAVLGVSSAETTASLGAASFNVAMAALAMTTAIAAQQKNDAAKQGLNVARSFVNLTKVISTI
jgi:hypothetical protein